MNNMYFNRIDVVNFLSQKFFEYGNSDSDIKQVWQDDIEKAQYEFLRLGSEMVSSNRVEYIFDTFRLGTKMLRELQASKTQYIVDNRYVAQVSK